MREFLIIDAAVSVEQLRMRLRESELEQYGEAFIPEFVYDVIRRLPRFSSMRVSSRYPIFYFSISNFILTERPSTRRRRILRVFTGRAARRMQ